MLVLASLALSLVAGSLACEWQNHCEGDPCQNLNDCDGDLICTNSKCAPPESEIPCTWTGHCFGDPCQTENDCDLNMICTENKCALPVEGGGQEGGGQEEACTWPGHCLGDQCGTENDCDGSMICVGGKCAPVGGEQTCTWHGHCIGNTCTTENDCSDNLTCSQSTCIDPTATVWPYNIAVSCYPEAGQQFVQVSGDHYNIGQGNIEILIRKQSTGQTLWGPSRFDAVKVPGRPGGSFDVRTGLACPVGQASEIHVYGADLFTGRYRDKIFYI